MSLRYYNFLLAFFHIAAEVTAQKMLLHLLAVELFG
jgi:hypothetical protein